MQEQIGKVTIQYREEETSLQTEAPEDARIRELLAEGYDCRLQQSPDWPVLYHLSHLRVNLTQWLPIKKTERVLEQKLMTASELNRVLDPYAMTEAADFMKKAM